MANVTTNNSVERFVEASPTDIASKILGAIERVRLSDFPSSLRDLGIVGLDGRARKGRFELWYVRQWVAGESDPLKVIGRVTPVSGTKTRVQLTSTGQGATVGGVVAFLGVAALIALLGGTGAFAVVCLAALMGLAALVSRASRGASDEERFLLNWALRQIGADTDEVENTDTPDVTVGTTNLNGNAS